VPGIVVPGTAWFFFGFAVLLPQAIPGAFELRQPFP